MLQGGQIRCVMGDVQMVNGLSQCFVYHPTK